MKLFIKLITYAKAATLCIGLALISPSGHAQQDTSGQGLRLNQSITSITDLTALTNARVVSIDYGAATASNKVDEVVTQANPTSDPRITAQTQAYGDGIRTIPEIETAAKAILLPQQTSLVARIRTAAAATRVAGAIWVFNQTVRPMGASRPMKISWYLMVTPGGRVITSDPKVVDEDPSVVHIIYYSKAVGRALPASYAWADAGLLKWQLRRYDGSPITGWTTVDTSGAYDSPESDSEAGPKCLATAQTMSGCVSGHPTARSLMAQTASRKSIIDYVRSVTVSYTPGSNGESTPEIQIAYDLRQYTRISCTAGAYRCAGSVGFTVVEAMDRYSMTDNEALPTKLNSIKGLNSSRPAATFDLSIGVSGIPAAIEPFIINPFDEPLGLIAKTEMPGIIRMAALQVEIPPTTGEYSCPPGTQVVGDACVTTQSLAANVTHICPSGSVPSGNICRSTTTTAATATTSHTCPNGGTLNGNTCNVAGTSYPASSSTAYSCSTGTTLSGTSCVSTTSTAATATTSFSCPNGGTRSGSTCTVTTTTSPQAGNVSASTSAADMSVGAGTPGFIEFGTIGDNYWGGGVYDRTMTFNIQDRNLVPIFSLRRAIFDDWLLLRVNGTTISVGPFGGDRLEFGWFCQPDGEGGSSCSDVRYGENLYGWSEMRRSWDFQLNVDLRPYLVNGQNTIFTRTIVGGRGESWVQFQASISGCPSGSTLSGGQCVSSTTYAATPSTSYSCPSGQQLSGTQCVSSSTTTATPTTTLTCPQGGSVSGSTCTIASTSYTASSRTSYSCSSGVLNGTQCVTTSNFAATPVYSCSTGTLSGANCITQTSSPATWAPLVCPD